MENLEKLLEQLRKKPALYLGEKSLVRLSAYIEGYLQACRDKGEKIVFYPKFAYYLADRFEVNYDHGWLEIITFFSSNQAHAVDVFFELLDEYKVTLESNKTNG